MVSLSKNENTLKFKCQFNEEERNKIKRHDYFLGATKRLAQICR